jgi:hypothetical protein
MNLASRLNRLEKRLGPPPQPSLCAIRLAMDFTREELELLERTLMQGDSFEHTPEIQDIHRRAVAVVEELARESMPKKIAGEL